MLRTKGSPQNSHLAFLAHFKSLHKWPTTIPSEGDQGEGEGREKEIRVRGREGRRRSGCGGREGRRRSG